MKKLAVILLLLISFSSNSAECLYAISNGNLRIDNMPVDACPSGLILLSKSDYDAISQDGIIATLKDLFEFSVEDFAYFNAVCLIGFIVGHSIGRVNRLLGKT